MSCEWKDCMQSKRCSPRFVVAFMNDPVTVTKYPYVPGVLWPHISWRIYASVGLSLFIVRAIPSAASGNTERGLPVTQANASVASLIQGAHPSEAVANGFSSRHTRTACIRCTRFVRVCVGRPPAKVDGQAAVRRVVINTHYCPPS